MFWRPLLRQKDFILRGFLCWAVAMMFLIFDSSHNHDARFFLRGRHRPSSEIVVLPLQPSAWWNDQRHDGRARQALLEEDNETHAGFWQPEKWQTLLSILLEKNPALIAVTFFFQPSPDMVLLADHSAVTDPRVIWASRLDMDGQPLLSPFAASDTQNTGLLTFRRDEDGIYRRFVSPIVQIPHLAIRAAERWQPQYSATWPAAGVTQLINFQGPTNAYATVSLGDVIADKISRDSIEGKLIVIGPGTPGSSVPTPVGLLSQPEAFAQVVDHLTGNLQIVPMKTWQIGIYLLILLVFAIRIVTFYPHGVAAVFLFWVGTALSALSFWIFDNFQIWTPVVTPLFLLGITHIVFLSYQLTIADYTKLRLEQEKRYMMEVEQLKNNFLSLFSHDLKTPLAKIQAICDRLLKESSEPSVATSLQALRDESSDLTRYIQNILRLSRVEAKEFRLQRTSEDLNVIAESVIKTLGLLAKAKDQKIEMNLEPIFLIEVDRNLIYEVILNLVENAVKYSPPNSWIRVVTREVNEHVTFFVEDSGQGLSPKQRSKIFDKFYSGSSGAERQRSTGLGLYLVKYFVELHGGQVFSEAAENGGLRVGFVLPTELPAENTLINPAESKLI